MRLLRRALPVAGIVALVLVDVALVYLAFDHVGRDDATAQAGDSLPSSTSPAPPTPRDGPAAGRFDDGEVLLDSADDTVIRGARGDCEGGGRGVAGVQVSSDGGASFRWAGLGGPTDVVRVSASSASELLVIAAGASCELTAFRSVNGGRNWTTNERTGQFWHLYPTAGGARSDLVRSPAGDTAPGCVVRSLSPIGKAGARVLCADGALRGTVDAGSSWASLGNLSDAVSIAYVDVASAWALTTTADCPAAVLETDDGGTSWVERACLAGGAPQAISVNDDDMLTAQVGGTIMSSAGGALWQRR